MFALSIFSGIASAGVNNFNLAILVNINDPESIEIAQYYKQARLIPEKNIIYLRFKAGGESLSEAEFLKLQIQLNKKVNDNIQAFALAWRKPWRVACMSITSAISLGFDRRYCATGCNKTLPVKYYNSPSETPYSDYNIRPSMMLSAKSLKTVKHLIDQGVSSDYTRPDGTAYLLKTSDKERNVRFVYYAGIINKLGGVHNIKQVNADAISNKQDVMFYFTGLKKIKWLATNRFLPGAIADHLTSTGGKLFNGRQMSVLDWIDAGVTGSYGTVVEPCNFLQKFPNPGVLLSHYLSGETLLEAYWKSVRMPGQGVFVGEPLAAPYKGCKIARKKSGGLFFINNTNNYVLRSVARCGF